MFFAANRLRSSPTDLANFIACRHKTLLDLRAARGEIGRPTWTDPLAVVLRTRGEEHERDYISRLRAEGLTVADLTRPDAAPRLSDEAAIAHTLNAMKSGADVIVQAPVGGRLGDTAGDADASPLWFGYADVLRRVDGPSALGAWHYEVHDTKLSTETKGGTILQLCVYTDLIATLQGAVPARFHVVTPEAAEAYRFGDFVAYYRLARTLFERYVAAPVDVYPDPTDHCEVCRWWEGCNARRRRDDHLSFVAGLGRTQQTELVTQDIATLKVLAEMPVPVPFSPRRGSRETYAGLREQARLQRQARETKTQVYELLPVEPHFGLCRLPEPTAGDLYLDLEGDPYVRPSGREYLFGLGWTENGRFAYRAWWALTDEEERAAFDELVALINDTIVKDPKAHVYHYAPYEPTAMKRLMGRYAIRETDIDALLRSGRFVDLYAVVRESLRAGVESYSIKKMEPFYDFTRDVELERAGDQRRIAELALEMGDPAAITTAVKDSVEGYNRDDVRSTLELHRWAERLRDDAIAGGAEVARFTREDEEASEDVQARQQTIDALRARLLARAATMTSATDVETATLLAYLIDWHYREDKVAWWEYFRLAGMTDEELRDERAAVAGLQFIGKVRDVVSEKTGKPTGSQIHRYAYPEQEAELHVGDALHTSDKRFGEVDALDRIARVIDIKRGKKTLDQPNPTALFSHDRVDPKALAESLWRFAEHVVDHGLNVDGVYGAGVTLLKKSAPRVDGVPVVEAPHHDGESAAAFAARIAPALIHTTLPIQGPPGSGKTYTGSTMICELVRQGKKVGVTATGHKVIANLLRAVREEADRSHLPVPD